MSKSKATVHGAVSIVNAIATGKGATLGTSQKTEVVLETSQGKGIALDSENKNLSFALVKKTVEKIVPQKELSKTKLSITLKTEVPLGFGLKSSSAISTAVALACAKLFKPKATDSQILLAGVEASIETKVSITGAYDDACGCYYGGFVVTDNYKRKIINLEKVQGNLFAVILIPRSRKRGNVKKLKTLDTVFERAWNFAKNSDYWNAMILNGYATASILNSNPKIISNLILSGALGASISGNGPAIAAITKKENISKVKKEFSSLEGRIIVSKINNKKAEAHEL